MASKSSATAVVDAPSTDVQTVETKPTKPLTATQVRSLTRLLHNDFQTLRIEITTAAERAKQDQAATIEREFAAKSEARQKLNAEALALKTKIEQQFLAFKGKATRLGFEASGNNGSYGNGFSVSIPAAWEPAGKAAALQKVGRDIEAAKQQALATLESERLKAERTVLLAGIGNGEAMDMLQTMPRAEALFSSALAGIRQPVAAITV